MTQSDFGTIVASTKSGTTLASDLNNFRTALNTWHGGATRPSYAISGMIWKKDVSVTQQEFYYYDGTQDILLYSVDTTNDRYTVSPYLIDFSAGTHQILTDANWTYFRPNGTTAGQWVMGTNGYFGSDYSAAVMAVNATASIINPASSPPDGFSYDKTNSNFVISRTGGQAASFVRDGSNGKTILFYRAGVEVGSISVTTTATTYTTSSDYRLKENVKSLVTFTVEDDELFSTPDVIKRILKWCPVEYNFIHDETKEIKQGFLAHELQAFAPYAVTGEKDQVDELGTAYRVEPAFAIAGVTEAEATAKGFEWEHDGGEPVLIAAIEYPGITRQRAAAAGCDDWHFTMTDEASGLDFGVGIINARLAPLTGTAIRREYRVPVESVTSEDAKNQGLIDWFKTGERAEYQGVDHSMLVPELTAALQATIDMLLETRKALATVTERLNKMEGDGK